jgi:hypothetical protein
MGSGGQYESLRTPTEEGSVAATAVRAQWVHPIETLQIGLS